MEVKYYLVKERPVKEIMHDQYGISINAIDEYWGRRFGMTAIQYLSECPARNIIFRSCELWK